MAKQDRQRGKGEGSIYPDGKGGWRASVELPRGADGRRRRKTVTGRTKPETRDKLNALKTRLGLVTDMDTRAMTYGEWCDYYLDTIAAKTVRAKTLYEYRGILDRYVREPMGRIPLDRVTVRHVRSTVALVDHMPVTAEKVYSFIFRSLARAVREGKIAYNEASRMDKPFVPEPDLDVLDVDELAKVIKHVSQPGYPLGALWLFYIFTGARRGEPLGLRWEDVHDTYIDLHWQIQALKTGTALPRHQIGHHVRNRLWRVRPKTKTSERRIPVVDLLAALLDRHRAYTGGDGYVFTRNGEVVDPDYATKQWPVVLKDAGIDKHVRLHDVRHSTVTFLLRAGIRPKVVMEIVGHSKVATTFNYEADFKLAELTEAMRTGYQTLPALEAETEPLAIEAA